MRKSGWLQEEISDLFSTVEESKKCGVPIKEAFKAHAIKYRRKEGSVRNFYYSSLLLKRQKDDERGCKTSTFDQMKNTENSPIISKNTTKNSENLRQNIEKMKNVVIFPQKKESKLSDADIKSLFLGLIRLVKKNAEEEADKKCERSVSFQLSKKDEQIEHLKEELLKLRQINKRLLQDRLALSTKIAEVLNKNELGN